MRPLAAQQGLDLFLLIAAGDEDLSRRHKTGVILGMPDDGEF
jgi:hypothetical protein